MLDDTDDILASAKRLAAEYPNRMWNTEEGFVTSTQLQVCVWTDTGRLVANVDIVTGSVVIWIGEVIDVEHELDMAVDKAIGDA
ncbi:hypothetical protein D3C87_1181340 [compost metagenome]